MLKVNPFFKLEISASIQPKNSPEYLKPADMNEDPEVLYLIEGDERQSLKVVTNKVGVKSAEVEWLKDGNPIANKLLGNEYGEDVYVETVSHRLKEVRLSSSRIILN